MASFGVLSLNLWQVPFVAPHSPARVAAALAFASADPRLLAVCFQEAWLFESSQLPGQLASAGFPNIAHLPSGAQLPCGARGPGLLIASRCPITQVSWRPFSAQGSRLRALTEMDGWAGKGVLLARLALPRGGPRVDLYTAHLVAAYGNKDAHAAARTAQALELTQFIEATRQEGSLTCVCGDLNAPPDSLPVRALSALCQLREACGEGAPPTCNTAANCFSRSGRLPVKLDFVLWGGGAGWTAASGETVLGEPCVPVRKGGGEAALCNVSDHCALLAVFSCAAGGSAGERVPPQAPPLPPRVAPAALLVELETTLAAGVACSASAAAMQLTSAAVAAVAAIASLFYGARQGGEGGALALAHGAAAAVLALGGIVGVLAVIFARGPPQRVARCAAVLLAWWGGALFCAWRGGWSGAGAGAAVLLLAAATWQLVGVVEEAFEGAAFDAGRAYCRVLAASWSRKKV